MNGRGNLIGGILAGAGLMYLLDPDRGRHRRATARDRVAHALNKTDDAVDTTRRDLGNRIRGAVAEARGRLRGRSPEPHILVERVRAELGRAVSHPHAIDVTAEDGTVTLLGPVLADEVDGLLSAVRSVRGVRRVVNRLDVHEAAGDFPGLQGGRVRRGRRPEFLQENWAPAPRFLAGLAGGALALAGGRSRPPLRTALRLTGLGLLARAATNLPLTRLTGLNAGRRAVEIQKSINVDAPVDEVFRFWSRYENFPRFMEHVREVHRTGERTSHWVAAGPAGTTFTWDAEVSEWIPNQLIRWRSTPGSTVKMAGAVRFQPNETGGTRVDVHLAYNPPAGALGHALARLFGDDPKHAMDKDLVRFKGLIEEGKTSAQGHEVHRGEIEGPGTGGTVW